MTVFVIFGFRQSLTRSVSNRWYILLRSSNGVIVGDVVGSEVVGEKVGLNVVGEDEGLQVGDVEGNAVVGEFVGEIVGC